MQCDASLDSFQSTVCREVLFRICQEENLLQILLMNGITASPLLFHEEHDQLHCLLRGNKRLVLVNTLKYPDVQEVSRAMVALNKV